MANFWDTMSNQNNVKNNQSNGFNIQDFIKFYNENKSKDMNAVLQNMLNSGQVTQEQVNNATSQAQGLIKMLQGIGIL